MITGVQDFYYNVSDMNKSVNFYRDVLGMKVVVQNDYWSQLEIDKTTIGLHWTEGKEVPEIPHDAHGAHCGGSLTLCSTNVKEDSEILEKVGVNILGSSNNPWGNIVVFQDLDGNIIKLMEPK